MVVTLITYNQKIFVNNYVSTKNLSLNFSYTPQTHCARLIPCIATVHCKLLLQLLYNEFVVQFAAIVQHKFLEP